MFLVALAFLVGHVWLHEQPELPPAGFGWAVLLPVATICLTSLRWRCARHCSGIVLASILGFCSAWWNAHARLADRWPELRSGIDVEIRGRVASIVEQNDDGKRFRFDTQTEEVPRHIEVTWYDTQAAPQPGELWQLRIRLRAPHGFANPGGYDYESQLLRSDTGASGYVREAATNRKLADAHWSYAVLRVRAQIAGRLADTLGDSPMLGIVQGLVVGETSRMTSAQWRVFANTGTTHLMAISGMHIAMVALCIAWIAGRGARYLPLQRTRASVLGIQATVGMTAALCYSALAGFSVPTQRTLIMLCVFLGARLIRRELAPTQGLAIALIGVLIVDPFAPLAVGFWLSFGAVAAIFLATAGRVAIASRAREYGRLQVATSLGLTPLVIGAFGSVSLIAPLVNLVAIPFFTLLIVPCVLGATAILLVSESLGSWFLMFVVRLLEWTWPLLEWASRVPLALWSLPQFPAWAFVLLLVGTVAMVGPGVFVTRFAGALLCLPALLWQPWRPGMGEFEIALLDVGQGLSVVVMTSTHTLVYDTGPRFRSGRDTGELVVVPYLHARGVRRIDALMASHGDNDHVGGMESVLAGVSTDRLMFGPSVASRERSEVCVAGQSWRWDGVRFDVLSPVANSKSYARRNDSSCVLRIAGTGGSAILFGDIERLAERQLLERGALTRTDIVIVPHHGSRTSSSVELVDATAPRYSLVSAGFGNQWGFPKDDVMARWRESGARQLQTAESGAIEIAVMRDGLRQPRAHRQAEKRYWYR